MARSMYKRFVVTIPGHLAAQVNASCETDGLNHSDFFCEAAKAYLAAKSREPQYAKLIGKDELTDNPFYIFGEWGSKADCIYDTLR